MHNVCSSLNTMHPIGNNWNEQKPCTEVQRLVLKTPYKSHIRMGSLRAHTGAIGCIIINAVIKLMFEQTTVALDNLENTQSPFDLLTLLWWVDVRTLWLTTHIVLYLFICLSLSAYVQYVKYLAWVFQARENEREIVFHGCGIQDQASVSPLSVFPLKHFMAVL